LQPPEATRFAGELIGEGVVNAIKLSNSRLKNIFVILAMTKLALPINNAKVDKNP